MNSGKPISRRWGTGGGRGHSNHRRQPRRQLMGSTALGCSTSTPSTPSSSPMWARFPCLPLCWNFELFVRRMNSRSVNPPSPSQHTPPSYPDCLGACLIFHPFCKPLNTSTILNKLKWKKISAGLSSSSFARICGPRFHNFTLFIQLKHNYLSLPFNFACWRLAVRSVAQHLSSVWYFSHRQSTKSVETWDKKVGKEMSRWV